MYQTLLASLALVPLVAAASSSLGCYSSVPNFKDAKQYTFQSHGYCLDQCLEAGFRIAALKDGVTCGCSNTIPLSSAKLDDDKCDQYCPGWPEDNCGGNNVYTVLATGDYDSDSESNSDSNSNSTVPSRTGHNIVAPTVNPSSIPTNILTAPSSVGKAGITALPSAAKSEAVSAGITAVTSTATPSATPNAAADTLRVGSMAGVLVAGLGLLL